MTKYNLPKKEEEAYWPPPSLKCCKINTFCGNMQLLINKNNNMTNKLNIY